VKKSQATTSQRSERPLAASWALARRKGPVELGQDAAHAGACLQDGGDAPAVPAADAMTDGSAEAHHNSITRIFPRLGETATPKRS
jgi:hypothetical protein